MVMTRKDRSSKALYWNCVVYPPDRDEPMFRCDRVRMAWYLERKLAVLVQEDPPVMRLSFQPKGPGHAYDSYFLQEFKNLCVVCGSEEDLTHHHIVPYGYRRYFRRDSYEWGKWMYDVLLLCVDCHDGYERQASSLKEKIAMEHGVPANGVVRVTDELGVSYDARTMDATLVRAIKASAALSRHGHKIPMARRRALEANLKAFLGKEVLSEDDFSLWKRYGRRKVDVTPAGQIIAEKLRTSKEVDDFAIRWRRHFVRFTKPKFLPEGWDPERRIYSERT